MSKEEDPKVSAKGLRPQSERNSQLTLKAYSSGVGEYIADMMLQKNYTWLEVSKLEGMPSLYQMQAWYDESEEFRTVMDRADKVLARKCIEDIFETTDESRHLDKDEVPSEKLWFDKKKWLVEKLDKSRFGVSQAPTQTTGSINIAMPVDYQKAVDISDIVDEKTVRNVSDDSTDELEEDAFEKFRGK
jgi:hypothetical protein